MQSDVQKYEFTTQQPSGSTSCGAYALCCYLGQMGFSPLDIINKLERLKLDRLELESFKKILESRPVETYKVEEVRAGEMVYQLVKDHEHLKGFCSPVKMLEVGGHFIDGMKLYGTPDLLKSLSQDSSKRFREKVVGPIEEKKDFAIKKPSIMLVHTIKTEVLFEGLHFVCLKNDNSSNIFKSNIFYDPGKYNKEDAKRNTWMPPINYKEFNKKCDGYLEWFGLWIE